MKKKNGEVRLGLNANKLKLYKYTKYFQKKKNVYPVCWFVPGYMYLEEPLDNQKEYILVNKGKMKRWYFYPEIFDNLIEQMPNDFYGEKGIYLFDRFNPENFEFIKIPPEKQLSTPLSDARLFKSSKMKNFFKSNLINIKKQLEEKLEEKLELESVEKNTSTKMGVESKHVNIQYTKSKNEKFN